MFANVRGASLETANGSSGGTARYASTGFFFLEVRPSPRRKLVTVIIEDTCYRILHGEEELAVKPRKDTSPITRLYVRGMKTQA